MRRRLARALRNAADRIDPTSGPRAFGGYFTIRSGSGLTLTKTEGVQVNPPVPGVPLWFMAEDYHRAFDLDVAP